MKLTRQDYILAGGQALLWITLWLIPPAIDFFIRFNPSSAFEVWKINTGFITPLAIVWHAKLLQKSEMRKDIVIELSYKGFG